MKAVFVTLLALVCVVGLTFAQWGTSSYYYPQTSDSSTGGYILGMLGLLFILFFLFIRDDDFTLVANFSDPTSG